MIWGFVGFLLGLSFDRVDVKAPKAPFSTLWTQKGELIALLGAELIHWDQNGHLRLKYTHEHALMAAVFDGEKYWVSANREIQGPGSDKVFQTYSFFIDPSGKGLGQDPQGARYVLQVGSTLFAPVGVFDSWESRARLETLFLAKEVAIEQQRGVYRIRLGQVQFMRMPSIFRDHNFNFKGIWIATDKPFTQKPQQFLADGGSFLVVHQLSPTVFRFDQKTVETQVFDDLAPTPMVALALPGYVPPPPKAFTPSRPMLQTDFRQRYLEELATWSLITWFGKTSHGFAICYHLVNLENGPVQSRVAFLDQDFKFQKSIDLPPGRLFVTLEGNELISLTRQDGPKLAVELHRQAY